MNWRVIFAGLTVALLGLSVFATAPTVYEYTVKTEQVQSSAASISDEEVVDYYNLTGEKRTAIHKAFKKEDHFLGQSSVEIRTEENLNLTKGEKWTVVNIDGVKVLTSIQGPEKTIPDAHALLGAMLFVVGAVIAVVFSI